MPDYSNHYPYVRAIVGEGYDVDNELRLDGEDLQIHIAKEIEAALPGKQFKMYCEGTSAKACFTEALTVEEKTILDQVFSDHKANV